jgi:hypothetical protein
VTLRWSFVAIFAALCLLLAPATSPASSRGFESRFVLEAGHGHQFVVFARGDTVQVDIGTPHSLFPESLFTPQSLTAYVARGTVTRRRIAASFGKFGRIDVRFRQIGKAVALPAKEHCRGVDHYTRQEGVFVGDIRFEGENRYVVLHSHRAPGLVFGPLGLHCSHARARAAAQKRARPVVSLDPGRSHKFLSASWRRPVASAELSAEVDRGRAFTSVEVEESLGRVLEDRFALAVSRPQVFAVDNALTRATLAPPAPFHGEGTYEAAPDGSKSWTGSLSVSFPGTPHWPLTGEQFKVSLGGGL